MDDEQEFFATPHHTFYSPTEDPTYSNAFPEQPPFLESSHGSPSFLSRPAYPQPSHAYQPSSGLPPSYPPHSYPQHESYPPPQGFPNYPQHESYPPPQGFPNYPQRESYPPPQSFPIYPQHESRPPPQSSRPYPQQQTQRKRRRLRQSGPIVSRTNTVDVTPTSRVGYMNYLGPGDILRYFHAIHELAESGKLRQSFLILITARLFKLVGDLLTTDPPTQETWNYQGIDANIHTTRIRDSCTVVWLVFRDPDLVLNRDGLKAVYPNLVARLGHLYDFRTLLHYYEGQMKRWPKKDRPSVGNGRVTPVKIDRDPIMLQSVFNPTRGRRTQGPWFQPQASAPCVRLRITQTIREAPGKTRFQDEEWNAQTQQFEKVAVPHQTQIIDFKYDDATVDPQQSVLLFVRHHDAEIERNTQPTQVAALFKVAEAFGLQIVLAGQPIMEDYMAFLAGCRTENDGLPDTCHAYCFKGQTLFQQMQYYASFRCAVGNNASALDLASGAGIPVFRDIEFPELSKSQNYEKCHNSFLRRQLNLGIKPWNMLEQEESDYAHVVPRKHGASYPIRLTDPRDGRYPCLKTPETLEKILFYFIGAVVRGRPEATQEHHVTLPDDVDLSTFVLQDLYSLVHPTKATQLDQRLAAMWNLFAPYEVKYRSIDEAKRQTYEQSLNPNFTEKLSNEKSED